MSFFCADVTPSDYVAIVDALYRFGAGQDLHDQKLFESAFSSDAEVDFTGPALRLGVSLPIFVGLRAVSDAILSTTSNLDTTHTVTNSRITAYSGGRASLFALVEAQHLPRDDHSRHLLLKNIYTVDLLKQGTCWVITHMKIENVWMVGDASVLFPVRP